MSDNGSTNPPTYRIGAVSRLTGVPADTLRVWERRYAAVTPFRADSGTRLYGAEDVGRLALIKRLVDRGDAISSVANLSLAQLRERVSGADLPGADERPTRPCRIAVMGAALSERLSREAPVLEGLDLVGLYDDPRTFLSGAAAVDPDVVLFDYPSLHGDQIRDIANLFAQSGAARAIVLYGFSSRATLERLDARRILTKRAPVDVGELRRWCLALHQSAGAAPPVDERLDEAAAGIAYPIPPRRFTDSELAHIATVSSSVRCECPHHLADLVSALAAFEAYSEECENRNAEDAAVHAFLHASTARARALMETALARVVEAEGIAVDPEEARTPSVSRPSISNGAGDETSHGG